MNNEAEQLEQAIKFLNGMMKQEEAQRFQASLDNNPELKAIVEEYETVAEAVDWLQYESLRTQMQDIATKKAKYLVFRKPWLAVAAGILFIIFAGLLTISNIWYTNSALASSYYEAPNFSTYRSGTTNFDVAKLAFENGDFEGVIAALSNENNLSGAKTFLLAHAYLGSGDYDMAIARFQLLMESKDERFLDSARWYAAISYLHNDNVPDAKALLKILKEEGNLNYQKEAQRLERQINSRLRFFSF